MLIDLSKIHLDAKSRLRAKHQNIQKLLASIVRRGLIQPIVLRPPHKHELPLSKGKEYVIEAGARRFIATLLLQPLFKEEDVDLHPSLQPGTISASIREQDSELMALEVEFHENEDRDNFDWKEKAEYIWKIHEGHKANDPVWTIEDTTAVLDPMTLGTVYRYLEFRKYKSVFMDDRVQNADSFRTARKQFDIVKALQEREKVVEFREQKQAEAKLPERFETENLIVALPPGTKVPEGFSPDYAFMKRTDWLAEQICQEGDCREWIKKWPDSSFDFIHWDPPYGSEQAGGTFTSFRKIDDSWSYAMTLLEQTLPDIYRTLKPGHWLVLWCHPSNINDISRLLSGHVLADDLPLHCTYCRKPWNSQKLQAYCPAGEFSFWVNPYPNHWYKVNRKSDGHEIKRFLINAEEPFLFAAKMGELSTDGELPDPILVRNDRQNVFTFGMVTKEERRHIMHKPKELLSEILSCISIPGEFGADLSYGSGSILEAVLESGRRAVGCELDHDNVVMTREVIEKLVEEEGIQPWEGLLT